MKMEGQPIETYVPRPRSAGNELFDRIHYACGQRVMANWLNVDGFSPESYPHGVVPQQVASLVYHVDLTARHPFPDESFQFAYAEDFIEHIDQKNAVTFLAEALRTLRPGGVLRIATPSLDGVMRRHFRRATLSHISEHNYHAFTRWGHQHFFCHETLSLVGLELGFKDYNRTPYGISDYPELCNLESRPEQIYHNLYAELVK